MGNHEQRWRWIQKPMVISLCGRLTGRGSSALSSKTLSKKNIVTDWLAAGHFLCTPPVEVQRQRFCSGSCGRKSNGVPCQPPGTRLLEQYLSKQSENDLLWIREEFWQYQRISARQTAYPVMVWPYTLAVSSFGAKNLNRSHPSDGLAQWVQSDGDKWELFRHTGGASNKTLVLRLDDLQEFVEPLQRRRVIVAQDAAACQRQMQMVACRTRLTNHLPDSRAAFGIHALSPKVSRNWLYFGVLRIDSGVVAAMAGNPSSPYLKRLTSVKRHHLAFFVMCKACDIKGASDASIASRFHNIGALHSDSSICAILR